MADAKTAAPAADKPAKKERDLLVLDTTATAVSGPRTHELIIEGTVKPFTFEFGKPLPLPRAVALKFLNAADSFKPVDDKGNVIPFRATPKQPDQLGAGETLTLSDDETIARYDELSTPALQARVLAMPGGEQFAETPARSEMIRFIVAAKLAKAKANTSREREVGADEFVPDAERDDEAAAA